VWNSETNIKGPPGPKGDKGDPGSGGASDWADITGKPATFPPTLPITEGDVTNLVGDLALKAPLASPVFTGNPTAPTPTAGDNDTSIATTAFVTSAVASGGGGGAAVLVSDTPPVGAADNSLWYESDTGNMYIRLNDGSSTQWVQVGSGNGGVTLMRSGMLAGSTFVNNLTVVG
jgi:hypothetical protein